MHDIVYMMINLSHVTKMLVNIILIAMGTVLPMSKVEGSWTLLSELCNTTLTYMFKNYRSVVHTRMRITGRSCQCALRTYQLQDESC